MRPASCLEGTSGKRTHMLIGYLHLLTSILNITTRKNSIYGDLELVLGKFCACLNRTTHLQLWRISIYQMFTTKSVRFTIAIFQRPPVGLLNYDSWRYVPTTAAAFFLTKKITSVQLMETTTRQGGSFVQHMHKENPVQPDSVAAKSLLVFCELVVKGNLFWFQPKQTSKDSETSPVWGKNFTLFAATWFFKICFWPHFGKNNEGFWPSFFVPLEVWPSHTRWNSTATACAKRRKLEVHYLAWSNARWTLIEDLASVARKNLRIDFFEKLTWGDRLDECR